MAIEQSIGRAPDQAPETNPFFGDASAASRKMAAEVRDQAAPLPSPTDMPGFNKPSVFSDTVVDGKSNKFPDTKIEGALLLADTKFRPSDSMSAKKADEAFEAMMAGNGRKSNVQSLDSYTQMDLRKTG